MADSQLKHLRKTFQVARVSRENGSHPFGATLVYQDKLFLIGENTVVPDDNPLKHAEIVVLENYLYYKKSLAEERVKLVPHLKGILPPIEDCQIYTSTEPCQMCEGAIYTMRVGKNLKEQIIFGLDKGSLSEVVRGHREHDRSVTKNGPNLLGEARKLHKGFWKKT